MKPLEESLLGLSGIEQAHVRLSENGPTGVRVVLAADADRSLVARAIKELFTSRGLTVVVDEGDRGSLSPIVPMVTDQPAEDQSEVDAITINSGPEPDEMEPAPQSVSARPPVNQTKRTGLQGQNPESDPVDLAVAVSEGPTYCDVAVRVGPHRRSVRRSNPDPVSIREAILDALNEASGRSGIRPTIVSVDRRSVDQGSASEKAMITVVLESAGQLGVGSALVRGTEFHAFGFAAMAALRYLPSF
ncbi:MAG: hypothetical protein JJE47_06055 [Acidimicrobiia bacterium]|nr:hypothetical protein [Acidimicrobiia bacterium]